ncbi:MAG: hypothetical protein U0441_25860 [Polyangiaceae bacterium]
MAPSPTPLDAIADHPRGDDLARLVHSLAFGAFDERRPVLSDGLGEAMDRLNLSSGDVETRAGHVGGALEAGPAAKPEGRALLGALLARGVALSPPSGLEAETRVAEGLVWLGAHAGADALPFLDTALAGKTDSLWTAVGDVIERADDGALPFIGRAGALVAAAGLAQSPNPSTQALAKSIVGRVKDPALKGLLGAGGAPFEGGLTGEMTPGPFGPIALAVLAATGLLFVVWAGGLFGRFVVRYRKPTELRVEPNGVTLKTRTEMLGRTLRERETHIPKEALLLVRREVRYPRLPLYAGLFALAVGSYLGISVFVDGVRAGSPDLLGLGALLFAVGVALDFALSHLVPAARGRCRLILVPRKGPSFALTDLDPALADAALRKLRAA